MYSVCITGSLATGKTYVSSMFYYLGIPIFYADQQAKKILQESPSIKRLLPKTAYSDIGDINKEVLSPLLLSTSKQAMAINKKIHKETISTFRNWKDAQPSSCAYCMKESAIIYESAYAYSVDAIIVVDAPEELRKKRYMERKNATDEKWERINAMQIPNLEKIRLANYVIQNDEQHTVFPQVYQIHKEILSRSS